MQRVRENIYTQVFYQKDAPAHFPDWIPRVTVPKSGGTVTHAIVDDAATLVYLANQGCITPHVWLSRVPDLQLPDRMIIDLDPGDGGVADARFAAKLARDVLDEAGLAPYLMATGSRGYHVVVPIKPLADFEEVRAVAFGLAEAMARRAPDRLTTEFYKEKRGGPPVPRLQPQRLGADGRAAVLGATQSAVRRSPCRSAGTSSTSIAPDDFNVRTIARPARRRARPVARVRSPRPRRSRRPRDGSPPNFLQALAKLALASGHERPNQDHPVPERRARLADRQRRRVRFLRDARSLAKPRPLSRRCQISRIWRAPVRHRPAPARRDRPPGHAARRLHGHDRP